MRQAEQRLDEVALQRRRSTPRPLVRTDRAAALLFQRSRRRMLRCRVALKASRIAPSRTFMRLGGAHNTNRAARRRSLPARARRASLTACRSLSSRRFPRCGLRPGQQIAAVVRAGICARRSTIRSPVTTRAPDPDDSLDSAGYRVGRDRFAETRMKILRRSAAPPATLRRSTTFTRMPAIAVRKAAQVRPLWPAR